MTDTMLVDHLIDIAGNVGLRQSVYDHMGEYCHQCRNRLNSLKLCIYLAKRQSRPAESLDLSLLEKLYGNLEKSIELIQTLCRPMAISLVQLTLDMLVQDRWARWRKLAQDHDVDLECDNNLDSAVAAFDPDCMGQALDALVHWRIQVMSPGSSARLRWKVENGSAMFLWNETPNAFDPPSIQSGSKSNWALPLMTRVAQAHGGHVQVQDAGARRVSISWPANSVQKSRAS